MISQWVPSSYTDPHELVNHWSKYPLVWSTYAVDVATSSLPLRIPVTTVRNSGERSLDVIVQHRGVPNVDFVTIVVAVSAAGMADFGSTGDD